MRPVALADACDERVYGGKAVQLGAAIRSGLPVPDGFALPTDLVAAVAEGTPAAQATLHGIADALTGPVAVRSSAVGEDSADASFAGQHATLLNVHGVAEIVRAVETVWQSAWSESALAYRRRIGAATTVQMGVVIQRLVHADMAGVMFTRNPVTGADELVIEASWGLGEAVVQGLVAPDLYRVTRTGTTIERRAGMKKVAVRRVATGGTRAEPVDRALARQLCLGDDHLQALSQVARRCDEVFGPGPHDVEWAFSAGTPYLLQRRPVSTRR